jgi:chromosome segregation ATPase
VKDKQMKSGAYKALEVTRKKIKKRLKEVLLKEHQKKKNNAKREEQIKEWTEELAQIEEQLKTTEKEMSRLDFLIEQNMVRLDPHIKQLMDVLKIIARNAFYKALQPFKEMYNNYRDDHVLFRNLTRSNGLIRERGNTLEAILFPTPHYPRKIRAIVERLLEDINAEEPLMPDGSNRQIHLRLGKKNGIKLAIVNEENDPVY